MQDKKLTPSDGQPVLMHRDGRLWFTREAERRFYFVLTVMMLAAGILYKMGLI